VILRQHALSEREESFIFGNVRAIHSAGYAVQRLLFKNEVTSLHISDMPVSKTEEEIKTYVIQKVRQSGKPLMEIMNVEILHANDEEGSVVLIQLNDPKDADIIMKKIDNDIWESHQMTVSISGVKAITAGLNNLISQYSKFQVIFRNHKSASDFGKAWKTKSKDKLFADKIASVKVMRGRAQCKLECFSTVKAQAAFVEWIKGKGYVANDGAASSCCCINTN
jgi:hypothetical protein